MAVLDHNLLFLPYNSSLAQMTISIIKEKDLIAFLSEQPLVLHLSVELRLLRPTTGLKGIKVVIEIVALGLNMHEILCQLLLGYLLIPQGEINLLQIYIIVRKSKNMLVLKKVTKCLKLLIDPTYISQ